MQTITLEEAQNSVPRVGTPAYRSEFHPEVWS